MSRVDLPEEQRSGFYLYVDEFQNFTTDSFASILSEARKYGLNLILAHQYMDQLSETGKDNVRNAIVGNVGTWVTFQVGPRDAERIVAEFEPNCTKQQLLSLDKAEIAVKLSIYGRTSIPFFAKTIAPIFNDFGGKKDFFINLSRQRYTRRRDVVNKELSAYLADTNFDNRKSNTKFLNKK
jgi:TraM recognition site of TraD and TraG